MTKIMTARLDELEHDPIAIDGHEARLKQLDDLLASIPHEGVLQSLSVRSYAGAVPKKGATPKWWVRAGNRRLATLRKLRDQGASVEGVKVTDAFEVHIIVKESDDAGTYAASRAENLMRLPETPVEEFRAFAKMATAASPKEIAARFGITERRVNQRLRLAQLHPEVLDALDNNEITMESAQAFTTQPDPEKQAAYLKKNRNNRWNLTPEQVKRAFTEKLVRGDGSIASLIGKKAYLAAGGKIMGDEFEDKASYWISPKIVDQLLDQHWEKQKKAWLDDGWLFVETADEFCKGKSHYILYNTEQLHGLPSDVPPKVASQIAAAEKKITALEAKYPWLNDDAEGSEDAPEPPAQAQVDHSDACQLLEQLQRDLPRAFTAEQKALSGVVYWPDGSTTPRLGMVKDGTVVPVALGGRGEVAARGREAALSLEAPGHEVVGPLNQAMNDAVGRTLNGSVRLTLQLLVATIRSTDGSPLELYRQYATDEEDDDGNGAPTFVEALAATEPQSSDELLLELAKLVAPGISISTVRPSHEALAFIALAEPKPALDEAYFAKLSKPLLQLAWRDMRSALDGAHKGLADGKQEDMAKKVAALAFDTKWLPPQLRTPSYTGPYFVTKKVDEPEQLQAAE